MYVLEKVMLENWLKRCFNFKKYVLYCRYINKILFFIICNKEVKIEKSIRKV